MTHLAATATPSTAMIALLLLTAVIVTVCYLFGCWLYPYTNCRRCNGGGKRRSPFGRAFGLCRRCGGDGRHKRLGRRILDSLRELHDKGSR